MVMGFEAPKTSGVHHDIAPPPVRMTMGERFAAASAKKKAEEGGEVIAVNNTPEDDRISELLRAVNEKTGRAARAARDAESIPVAAVEAPVAVVESPFEAAQEAAPEAKAEAPKTVAEMTSEEKAAYQETYREAIWKKKAAAQANVMEERAALLRSLPQVSRFVPEPEVRPVVEQYVPPVKTGQRIFCPLINGFAYVLAVEAGSREVTLVRSLAEVQKAQRIAQSNEKGLRESGGVQIPITFDQCRQFLEKTPAAEQKENAYKSEFPEAIPIMKENPAHPQNRYKLAA